MEETKEKRLLVGVCGGQWGDGGVGKTTVVNILAKHMGFCPASFTAPVRDVARRSFGWDGKMDAKARVLLDGICRRGRAISDGYWRNLAMAAVSPEAKRVVMDDLWFEDEAMMIVGSGGFVIRVTKKGHGFISMPCPVVEIQNDGGLLELRQKTLLAVTQAIG